MPRIYHCPTCGVAVEFMPNTQMFHCSYCGTSYTAEELEDVQKKLDALGTEEKAKETMQMTILHCTACGAELAVDGTEASTFCSFCGQATVVTDRLEGWLRPDYIIPFAVTKETAEKTIRARLAKGFFIPKKVKQFETETLRGIYIPFWMFDVYYGDSQDWKYEVSRGITNKEKHCRRIADCHFKNMTLDASANVPDASSQRLEPYDMNGLMEFDPVYLSGFYSNRYDVEQEEAKKIAVQRAGALFDAAIEKDVHNSGKPRKSATFYYKSPKGTVLNPRYALLPAWFLTFRQDGIPHTILINGETDKMVGAVPYVKAKAYAIFAILAVLFSVPLVWVGYKVVPWIFTGADVSDYFETGGSLLIGTGLLCFSLFSYAVKTMKALNESCALTRSGVTDNYVKERQGR